MKTVKRLTLAAVVEIWILLEYLFQKVGFERYSEALYARLRKKSPLFLKCYNLFIASFYRKHYRSFPVESDLVFLDCFWGRKVGDHPYAIYREILRDTTRNWRFIWVRNPGVAVPQDVARNPNVSFVEHRSVGYATALLKAGVLVCNSNFLPYFARRSDQVFINTWHGIPLKTLGLDTPQPLMASLNTQRNFNQATLIPMASRWATEKVVGSYGANLAMAHVVELGSPRIDLMLNADVDSVRAKSGIPKDKKVILYAPTWRGAIGTVSKSIADQIEAINIIRYAALPDYELYVSLHHLTRHTLGAKPSGISYVPDDVDISEFLSVVDVLISDYSSIFIDYLVLDRPIILHVPDLEAYQRDRGLLLDIHDLPVMTTYDGIELAEKLSLLRRPSEFPTFLKYKELWLPHEDGRASGRCWQAALQERNVNNTSTRMNVLIHGGMLAANGITQSLLSLLNTANGQRYRFWVVFNPKFGGRNSVGESNFFKIRNVADVVLVPPGSRMVASEHFASGILKKFDQITESLSSYYSYEARRLLGGVQFDYYIDFSGYSSYWAHISPHISTKMRAIYLHSDMYEEWRNRERGMSRLATIFNNYKYFDYLVSVSDACHEQNSKKLSQYIRGKARPVAVPNSFDGERVLELSRTAVRDVSPLASVFLGRSPNAQVFITISRLSPEKNLETLIEAFKKLKDTNINAVLLIVGEGVERRRLEQKVQEWDLTGSVCFVGFAENPFPLLRASDCLVFPSKYEGQGLALLEALTLGKYCIASDIPAAREILEGGFGDLVAPTSEALYKALLNYCTNSHSEKSFNYQSYLQNASQRFDALLSGELN